MQNKYGILTAGDAGNIDTQLRAILRALKTADKAGQAVLKKIWNFLQVNGKNISWEQIPLGNKKKLLADILKELGAVNIEAARIIPATSGQMIQTLNTLGESLGVGGFEGRGLINVAKAYQQYAAEYALNLTDIDTRRAGLEIQEITRKCYETGDFKNWRSNIEDALGVNKPIASNISAAIGSKDAPLKIWQSLGDAAKEAGYDKTYNWKVTRIMRSEAAKANAKINDEWIKSLGDLVIGEEFVAEPDACDKCKAHVGFYQIGEAPRPVDDTHPNCNCRVIPVIEGEVDKSELKAGF